MLIALAEFLGYEPSSILCFDNDSTDAKYYLENL